METKEEGVLTITVGGELEAIVYNHPSRHQVFYKVEEMGTEDIENLLKNANTK